MMHKLETVDGFIAFDLVEPPASVGVTRLAPKILADGAALLARSVTYSFATFERQVGGASAGINAKPEGRDDAVGAFVDEVSPLVESGRFCTQAARGLSATDLSPLRALDPRGELFWEHGNELRALTAAVSTDSLLGGLDGRRLVVEAHDDAFPWLVRALGERGARMVGLASAKGFVASVDGIDPESMAQGWTESGADLIAGLGPAVPDAAAMFGQDSDALLVGSKAGLVDHEVAEGVATSLIVPSGPVPVTSKALAVLRRAGVGVAPDFVSTAGSGFAMWPAEGASLDSVRDEAGAAVAAVLAEVAGHPDGPLLASCYRAEAYLSTWQESLPFGRPLA
jgi:glutamate dehydrogenase/leucine dehydrogenase